MHARTNQKMIIQEYLKASCDFKPFIMIIVIIIVVNIITLTMLMMMTIIMTTIIITTTIISIIMILRNTIWDWENFDIFPHTGRRLVRPPQSSIKGFKEISGSAKSVNNLSCLILNKTRM